MEQEINPVQTPNSITHQSPLKYIHSRIWITILIAVVLISGYLALAKYQNWWPFNGAAVSVCNNFTDPLERNHCITDLAIKSNNSDLCKKIDGDKDGCYRSVGETMRDVSVCNKIQSSRAKEYCILHVGSPNSLIPEKAVTKGNCAGPDIQAQDRCYAEDAFGFGDPSLCEKVQNPVARDDCYTPMQVALQGNNTCGKIQDIQKRERCYKGVAQQKRDFQICDMVNSEGVRSECYRSVSYEIGYRESRSKCDDIKDQNLKNICYDGAKSRAANP